MKYIQGTDREQIILFNKSLDDAIDEESSVRLIDAFVDKLDLSTLGFIISNAKTGAPSYSPHLMLKIYVYGYLEKIRTSRRLEKECNRNKELIWLTGNLAPDFKTIADFRKNNVKGISEVFKEFLRFCRSVDLLSLSTIAIDGTKMRAQNSQNNIFKRKEIDKIERQIEEKVKSYLSELDTEDELDIPTLEIKSNEEAKGVISKLKKLVRYKNKVSEIKEFFKRNPNENIVFANDKDSRFQSDKGKVRAGYNPQTAVDDKYKLIVVSEVTNESNDQKQITPMIKKVDELKDDLNIDEKTDTIFDAGYYSENQIVANKNKKDINIIVSTPNSSNSKKQNPNILPSLEYKIDKFKLDEKLNRWICPEGKTLVQINIKPQKNKSRLVNIFQCQGFNDCDKRHLCTKNKKGRTIGISINHEEMESFKEKMTCDENKKLILKRKEIVEHPFGTIKRTMGYTYFLQTGIEKVKTEFSFICFIYNFKRVTNILKFSEFKKALEIYYP